MKALVIKDIQDVHGEMTWRNGQVTARYIQLKVSTEDKEGGRTMEEDSLPIVISLSPTFG